MPITLNEALLVVVDSAALMQRRSNELAAGSSQDLIKHLLDVRKAYEAMQEVKKLMNGVEEQLSRMLIPDAFKRDSIKTITVEGVGRTTVSYRYSCSMLDKPKAMDYLRNNGAGSLIQETVNAQSLAAYSKELLTTKGQELPDNLFKVSTSPYTSITKV